MPMPASAATSQVTTAGAGLMPPQGASGSGASRVQMTKPSAAGSPEATPSENGNAWNCARAGHASGKLRPAPSAALNSVRRSRRRSGRGDIDVALLNRPLPVGPGGAALFQPVARARAAAATGSTMTDTSVSVHQPAATLRLTARALLVGERLDTAGLERSDVISTTPLAFRIGQSGYCVLFRYGVIVLVGLSPLEEDDVVRGLGARIIGRFARTEDETAVIEVDPKRDDKVAPGGPICVHDLSPPRLLVIADALAKNVALTRDEHEVRKVLELIEPFAAELARSGRPPSYRRQMLRTIGQALLVQHRMSGRVEVEEKPDVLWDNPQVERLYARLEDEYELKERAAALARKLRVIDETTHALTDIIDTARSIRLEATIVVLIVVEILIAFYELFFRLAK